MVHPGHAKNTTQISLQHAACGRRAKRFHSRSVAAIAMPLTKTIASNSTWSAKDDMMMQPDGVTGERQKIASTAKLLNVKLAS